MRPPPTRVAHGEPWFASVLRAGAAAALLLAACSSSEEGATPSLAATPSCGSPDVVYDTGGTNGFGRQAVVASGLANFAPIDVAFVPGTGGAFVVASQGGYLHYFNGRCDPVNVLDLRALLPVGSSDGEQGLLNIEFHPDYASNRYLFVYHTSVAGTVNSISRMTVAFDAGGNLVPGDGVRIIDMRKGGSASNHNGGGMAFAPDKTLLASVGDGGSGVGPSTAQDNRNLLGKVVRIAPSLAPGSGGYSIPPGNMFAASNAPCTDVAQSATACPEILAMGLRNPFRLTMDGNLVFLGDVGSVYEEINSFDYTRNTLNFGWPTHDGPVTSPAVSGYRNPIVAYRRNVEAVAFRAEDPMATASGAASVIVGAVYRGSAYGGILDGTLWFGDFYDGFNRYVGVAAGSDGNGAITDSDGAPGAHLLHAPAVTSVVRGPDGLFYFTTLFNPAGVYRLVRP